MARCKDNEYLQLQDKSTHRKCVCSNGNVPEHLTVRAAACIAGAPPPGMSLCGRSKITFQATWLQPNNACLVTHSHIFLFKKKKKHMNTKRLGLEIWRHNNFCSKMQMNEKLPKLKLQHWLKPSLNLQTTRCFKEKLLFSIAAKDSIFSTYHLQKVCVLLRVVRGLLLGGRLVCLCTHVD